MLRRAARRLTQELQVPKFESAIPVLPSLNIERSLEFYSSKLGCSEVQNYSNEYGVVARDGIAIHFWSCNDPEIPKSASCRVKVQGVDELYDELRVHGIVHEKGALADKPWGVKEFAVVDCDGNLLTFFEFKPAE